MGFPEAEIETASLQKYEFVLRGLDGGNARGRTVVGLLRKCEVEWTRGIGYC
jgi:hypothetical protein